MFGFLFLKNKCIFFNQLDGRIILFVLEVTSPSNLRKEWIVIQKARHKIAIFSSAEILSRRKASAEFGANSAETARFHKISALGNKMNIRYFMQWDTKVLRPKLS